jgi:hypothetical protein
VESRCPNVEEIWRLALGNSSFKDIPQDVLPRFPQIHAA